MDNYLAEALLKKNQAALSQDNKNKNYVATDGLNKKNARTGYCTKWSKSGDCASGDKCPWAASHTAENRSWYSKNRETGGTAASAKSKGKGKKGKDRPIRIRDG